MFACHNGLAHGRKLRITAARLAVSAVMASLAGCASNQTDDYAMQPGMAQKPAPRVAIEMEADGLPAQTPPPKSIRNLPDDPSEPWSPNYGGVNPSASPRPLQDNADPAHKTARIMPADLPQDLPPDFRRKLVASLNVPE